MRKRNVMVIVKIGGPAQAVFRAPTNRCAALALWVFLVENLQPGFVVGLNLGEREKVSRATGEGVPIGLYRSLMGDHTAESNEGIRK